MKHVSILVPEGHFSMVNVEGTHQMLQYVNLFLEQAGRAPLFQVQLVGIRRNTTQTNGLFAINPEVLLPEVTRTDIIVVPAIHGAIDTVVENNRPYLEWIVQQYKQGAEVVSMCVGAFFVAATGLLNGKPCATHWRAANDFRRLFPDVNLQDDKIMTEADGIYTSGGAYSFTNLLLYLIEKHAGRDIAILTAKTFMIDIERSSQSPFLIFAGQKQHGDEAVLQAQAYIETHYPDKLSVDDLTLRFGVGRRSFERRFKKATCNTVVEYIQRVKVEAAKKQLEGGRKTVAEVMYEVGYNDNKAFRDVFRKLVGMSPVDYRQKYNGDLRPVHA